MPVCVTCQPVVVAPVGSDGDDAPSVQAAAEANAYSAPVQLAPGTFVFKTPCQVPSGTVLLGSPDTHIVSKIAPNGDVTRATFVALPVLTRATTTLSEPNAPGTSTLNTQAPIAPGSLIIVSGGGTGLRAQYYTVEATEGSGPYTLVLDRGVLDQFTTDDLVTVATSRPSDILIIGNGMTISGTAERFGEFAGAYRSVWDNVVASPADGAPSDIMFSFDIGGRDNVFSRMEVDGGGQPFAGLALESNEGSNIIDSTATSTTDSGLLVLDSFNTLVENSSGRNSYIGLFLSTDADNGRSCTDTDIEGGTFSGNTYSGIAAFSGALRTRIDGASTGGNVWYGITLNPEGATFGGTAIKGVSATANGHAGLVIGPGASNTTIEDLDVSGGGSMGVYALDGFDSVGLIADGGNPLSSVYFAPGAFSARISYGDIRATESRGIGIYVAPQNTVNIDHTVIKAEGPASTGLDLTGGICNIEHTTLEGPASTLPPGAQP